MPDSPTPAQLLALWDIVWPEPPFQAGEGFGRGFNPGSPCDVWNDARNQFRGKSPRDAVAEIEQFIREAGWRIDIAEYTYGWRVLWLVDRADKGWWPAVIAEQPDELAARVDACIKALVLQGKVTPDQAGMIEGMRECL